MAEEKHHHLFHHKNKEEEEGPVDYENEVKHHSHLEKVGELGAAAAGAFAMVCQKQSLYPNDRGQSSAQIILYARRVKGRVVSQKHEKHKAKKDPEHAHKHKIEEEIAAAAAVGAGGFAFHEHHDKKDAKKEQKEAEGGKHHHLF